MIIEAIIMYLGVLAWDVISDYRKWLKRKTVKHKLEWALRVLLLLPSAIGFAGELANTVFIIALFFSYLLLGSFW